AAGVARLGGADEVVVADIELPGHLAESRRNSVGKLLRRDAGRARRLLDLLAMFIGAGQEPDATPIEPHESRQHIAGYRRIGMAQVRQVVDIIDRRGDEEGPFSGHEYLQGPNMGRDRSRSSRAAKGFTALSARSPRMRQAWPACDRGSADRRTQNPVRSLR